MSIIEKAIEKLGAEAKPLEKSVDNTAPQQNSSFAVDSAQAFVEPSIEPEPEVTDQSCAKPVSDDHFSAKSEPEDHNRDDIATGELLELPVERLKSLGMLTPEEPRSRVAEEYRIIKRPLLMNIQGRGRTEVPNSNLIMVTSARPGEGKTFTAINLAISIAMEQDKTVLFVDADVAKASAAKLLGIPGNAPGLIDILMGDDTHIGDVLLRTNVPNLRVLPAGPLHERSTELLASRRMHHLMEELSDRYSDRVIIFDSPPLLFTTEASVLANLMGQVAFVVAENMTPQHKVTEALSHIDKDKAVGLVLNKAKRGNSKGSDGYGYGYGYGYGDDRSED